MSRIIVIFGKDKMINQQVKTNLIELTKDELAALA